jgi:steroid delta-isomerase-like uncharacterized protein
MSTEENKALDRHVLEEVWHKGNLAVVDELADENVVNHIPQGPALKGPEAYKQFVLMYRSAFPDLRFTIDDQIAEGDKVVMRYTARGTHKGELMGIPPTGKQITVTGITIGHIVGGKYVESWANYDALGMMQQLGVIPSMG